MAKQTYKPSPKGATEKMTPMSGTPTVSTEKLQAEIDNQRPLGSNNYLYMAIAGVMIVVGFLLMLGGSSTEEAFNPDIFSTRRIVIGPAIAFLGFLFMGVAIILKPTKK